VRKFHSSEYINALAAGEICLVVGFSGDVKQAQKRAAEAKNGIDIGYVDPRGRRAIVVRQSRNPKDANHVAEAHALINYLLEPQVAARNSNFVAYANGKRREPSLHRQGDPGRSRRLPRRGDDMKRLYTITAHDQKDATPDEPPVDADQDREVKLQTRGLMVRDARLSPRSSP